MCAGCGRYNKGVLAGRGTQYAPPPRAEPAGRGGTATFLSRALPRDLEQTARGSEAITRPKGTE